MKDRWTSKYDNNGGIGVLRSAHQSEALGPFVGPGRWNDMDMLQIGVDGFDYGHDRKEAGFDITPDEERFQMSLWAQLNVRGPREVTDLWEHRSLGRHDKLLKFEAVPSHGVVFVRLSK